MIQPVGYKFKKPSRWDTYAQALVEKKVGVRIIGATETGDTLILFFERALTDEERVALEKLMENPPYPEHRFEVKPITEDDVERAVGVRPILLSVDNVAGRIVRIAFEKRLTSEQVLKLKQMWSEALKFEEV